MYVFFTNEDISVLKLLGKYIIDCLDIRRGDYCCHKYSVYMYSVCHYFVSDSVRHKMLYCYMYIELIFVLYVTLCLFGGP